MILTHYALAKITSSFFSAISIKKCLLENINNNFEWNTSEGIHYHTNIVNYKIN